MKSPGCNSHQHALFNACEHCDPKVRQAMAGTADVRTLAVLDRRRRSIRARVHVAWLYVCARPKRLVSNVVLWAIGERITLALDMAAQAQGKAEWCERVGIPREVTKKLDAWQALDVGLGGESGKIVLAAHIGGQDLVKIINVRSMALKEYRALADSLEGQYGADARYVDAGPYGTPYFKPGGR